MRYRAQLPLHNHQPTLHLRGGATMPAIGLGTSRMQGNEATQAVEFALRHGYRALDMALIYNNHLAIAEGISASGVPREEIFLISKVPPSHHGFERAAEAIQLMLSELKSTYIDLCLIHTPGSQFSRHRAGTFAIVERAGTWRALEKAHRLGKCRHIGVSNYLQTHLEELFEYAIILPAVNQIEHHPYMVDRTTVDFCHKNGIVVQAFGSINAKGLMQEPLVHKIAKEVTRSPAQVLLRWAIQERVMVLPKASNEFHILENARLWDFVLTMDQQNQLSKLNRNKRHYEDSTGVRTIFHSAPD
eukprot:gnl/MRDRNA2_/MRDRNA2_74718_c0_seq1.p1 gnl/MRDRNA2_/MRDRNA2_74718_c0~~gnl/MRDRNA2_/MRDRNA2_74718_c0_seq1.p1  ORF type:complete len:302 (+),score=47.21 gnl/MRDRNA2_/MRDRNA2_74718_c0_seq1:59-964(+)